MYLILVMKLNSKKINKNLNIDSGVGSFLRWDVGGVVTVKKVAKICRFYLQIALIMLYSSRLERVLRCYGEAGIS